MSRKQIVANLPITVSDTEQYYGYDSHFKRSRPRDTKERSKYLRQVRESQVSSAVTLEEIDKSAVSGIRYREFGLSAVFLGKLVMRNDGCRLLVHCLHIVSVAGSVGDMV